MNLRRTYTLKSTASLPPDQREGMIYHPPSYADIRAANAYVEGVEDKKKKEEDWAMARMAGAIEELRGFRRGKAPVAWVPSDPLEERIQAIRALPHRVVIEFSEAVDQDRVDEEEE